MCNTHWEGWRPPKTPQCREEDPPVRLLNPLWPRYQEIFRWQYSGVRFYLVVDRLKGIDGLPVAQRPVHHHSLTYDVIFGHEAPVARVIADRAVVTHDEKIIGRNCHSFWLGAIRRTDIWFVERDAIDCHRVCRKH